MLSTQEHLPVSVNLFHVVKVFLYLLPSQPELSKYSLILFHPISLLC